MSLLSDLVSDRLSEVRSTIKSAIRSAVPDATSIAEHILLGEDGQPTGKLLRPSITIAMSRFVGEDKPGLAELAAAVELLHNASLLHDDVIDETNRRRNKETAHVVYGNKNAILGGDFLFTKAFQIISDHGTTFSVKKFLSTAEDLSTGEILQSSIIGNPNTTLHELLLVTKAKTASLFSSACFLGAHNQTRELAIANKLAEYGENLGIAFQIRDDILDYTGDPAVTGKPIGTDLVERKITVPLYILINGTEGLTAVADVLSDSFPPVTPINGQDRLRLFSYLEQDCEMERPDKAFVQEVSVWLESSGAMNAASALGRHYVEQAKSALLGFPTSRTTVSATDALIEAAEDSISRLK